MRLPLLLRFIVSGLAAGLLGACAHAQADAGQAATIARGEPDPTRSPVLAGHPAPIPDMEPAVTRQVADVLDWIAQGKLPHEQMTERADAAVSAQASAMGGQLRPCPRPLALELLTRRVKGEDRQYQYRLACGARTLQLDIDFNKAARINRLELRAEP